MKQARPYLGRRKTPQRREGAVLLVVLLMLLMATGTALYAMQTTFYEQGASTSYAEAAWTRSLAEGAAMGALIVVEEGGTGREGADALSADWRDQGSGRADFSIKYGLPTPLSGFTPPLGDAAFSLDNAADDLAFASIPGGLTSFCLPTRDGALPYGAFRPHARTSRCHAIYEEWTNGSGVSGPAGALGRERVVITGIGETAYPGEPTDADGQRGLHETVGMTRGYFDHERR